MHLGSYVCTNDGIYGCHKVNMWIKPARVGYVLPQDIVGGVGKVSRGKMNVLLVVGRKKEKEFAPSPIAYSHTLWLLQFECG